MTPHSRPRKSPAAATGEDAASGRITADERREDLLDVAFELLRDGGPEAVSMGSVAERAEVTRALVYKHFANRGEVLNAVYRREAARLDAAMVAEVSAAKGLEARLRSFVQAVLRAVDTHGWIFLPLQPQSAERGHRREQRTRDRRTVRAFADMAAREFGLSRSDATIAVAVLLSGVTALRSQARARPSAAERKRLEELYVDLALGALRSLGGRRTR